MLKTGRVKNHYSRKHCENRLLQCVRCPIQEKVLSIRQNRQ